MVAGCDTSHAGCGKPDGMDAPLGRDGGDGGYDGCDGCEGYDPCGGCEGYPFPGIAAIALVPISAISLPSCAPGRDPLGDPFGEIAGAAAVGMSATPGDCGVWGVCGAAFDAAKAAIQSGA